MTTETKHTPGPWTNEETAIIDSNGYHVATITDDSKALADARLIAAAPALLEILEAIVEDCGYGGGGAKLCDHFLQRAKSAIAQATE